MKILIVPTTDWIGHPVLERQHQIFERLANKHDIHVLRFRYYEQRNLDTKVIVHEIDDGVAKSIASYYLVNITKHRKAITDIVKGNSIDTVVLSNLLPALTSIRALGRETSTVFDLSDHFPTSGAGYLFDIHSAWGKVAAYSLEMILRRILTSVDCTVACSHPLRDYAARLGARNTTLIPNGVDDLFLATKHNGDDVREKFGLGDSVVIGFVGMVEFWLNMTPLLHAIRELKRQHRVKLFVVGKQFQTKAYLKAEQEIRQLHIDENVVWTRGFVPYKELPDYIAAMDICAIPFDHYHPTAYYSSPNKLWEYLALGKTVLSTPLPDIVIQAGEYVNIVETSQDYVTVVEDCVRNPERYAKKAQSGKKAARDFTWGRISEAYERLMLDLDCCGKRRAAGDR